MGFTLTFLGSNWNGTWCLKLTVIVISFQHYSVRIYRLKNSSDFASHISQGGGILDHLLSKWYHPKYFIISIMQRSSNTPHSTLTILLVSLMLCYGGVKAWNWSKREDPIQVWQNCLLHQISIYTDSCKIRNVRQFLSLLSFSFIYPNVKRILCYFAIFQNLYPVYCYFCELYCIAGFFKKKGVSNLHFLHLIIFLVNLGWFIVCTYFNTQ